MASTGEYQIFENVASIPADIRETLAKFRDSNEYCVKMMAQVTKTMSVIDNKVNASSQQFTELHSVITDAFKVEKKEFNMRTILDNVQKHPMGLMLSIGSMLKSKSGSDFITHLVSTSSMLGFEEKVVSGIRDRWSKIENPDQLNQYQFSGNATKIVCLLLALLGKTTVGASLTDIASLLRESKKNANVYKEVIEEIEDFAEEHGFGFSSRARLVNEMKNQIEELLDSMKRFEQISVESPIKFCRQTVYNDFKLFSAKVEQTVSDLAKKKFGDFIGTSMSATIFNIHNRQVKLKTVVEQVRRTNGNRVVPVGIALYGSESQIGKSHLMAEIETRVKKELYKRHKANPDDLTLQAFMDVPEWETWNQSIRDKYDQNQQGQEGHCIDDCFTSKEQVEHQMLITYISPRAIPTYQADLSSKGLPYNARYVMVSCNTFPRESTTVNNVHALAERFPIFVHCKLKAGKTPPAYSQNSTIDTSFDWLDLHLGSGHDYFHKTVAGACCQDCFGRTVSSIDGIVNLICHRMIIAQKMYDSQEEMYKNNKFQGEFYNCNDGEYCAGKLSNFPDVAARSRQFVSIGQGYDNIPQQIWRAIRSSKCELTTEYKRMLELDDDPEENSRYWHYFQNNTGIRNIGDIFYNYHHFKFVAPGRYQQILDDFFAQNYILDDGQFVWYESKLYLNDVFDESPLQENETADSYRARLFPLWDFLYKMFCDSKFLIYGLVFVCLNLLGLHCVISFSLVTNMMRLHTIFSTGYDPIYGQNSDSSNFFQDLVIKAFTALVLWIVFKIFSFIVKKMKSWIFDPVWNRFSREKEIFCGDFEYSKVTYVKRNLYRTINNGTVVFVTATGESLGKLNLLRSCKVQPFGSNFETIHKGVNIVFMFCLTEERLIDRKAFANCLDRFEGQELYFPDFYFEEGDKILLEQHGNFKKIVCYGNTIPNGLHEYSNAYDQHHGRKAKTVKTWVDDGDSDAEVLMEAGANNGSGDKNRKRQNRFVRKYEAGANNGSGDKNRKRQNRFVRRYEGSGRFSIRDEKADYEASRFFGEFIGDTKISASEDSFGEDDYNPSCVENVLDHAYKITDLTLESVETVDEIIFPKCEKSTIYEAEELLAGEYESAVDPNANAILRRIRDELSVHVLNTTNGFTSLYGVGCGEHVIFPSHLVSQVGDVVQIRRSTGASVISDVVYLAKVVSFKREWELCGAKLLPIRDSRYRDIERPSQNLVFPRSLIQYVPKDHDIGSRSLTKYCLQYLPKQGFIIPGMVSYVKNFKGKLSGIKVECEIFAMQTLPSMNAQTIGGDCGGAVVILCPRATRKLVGLHIGSAANVVTNKDGSLDTRSTGLIAILSEERVHVLTEHAYERHEGDIPLGCFQSDKFPKITWAKPNKYDNFHELITDDDIGLHLPHDSDNSIVYWGDLKSTQVPCDINGKTDHNKTPFYGCFEEHKKPSALIESQVPDPSKLLHDANGRPSIIVTQVSGYAGKTYTVDEGILGVMVDQLTDYMSEVMAGHAIGTSQNKKTAMWEALNGQYFNDDFDKLNEKSSSGIPWTNFGISTKNGFLKTIRIKNMYRTSETDKYVNGFVLNDHQVTDYFKRVFGNKMREAKNGKRTVSFWKACLKDELRDLDKIEIGKTRAFIAPPMETFLMGRYLFGRWKAAFKSNASHLFHALGIDMKSLDVTEFVNRFRQFNYFIDVDYKNFDQNLLSQFIKAAAVVIIETIRRSDGDDAMALARYVYFEELIHTLIVAFRTVFETGRGNKSGNVLTTELNCIVNFLYGWYVFIRVTGNKSLQFYLKHVLDVNFGDDKAIAITLEAAEMGFNFHSYKKIMAEMGQTVTPGNKSEIETPYLTSVEELRFLKRNFKQLYAHVWVAPLDKLSIESVFNYSCLTEEDVEEWCATIYEQLMEAMLHGKTYYNALVKKLRTFVSTYKFKQHHYVLREAIMPILLNRYCDMLQAYFVRIGILDSSVLQNEKIICELSFENGRTTTHYKTLSLKAKSENQFESDNKFPTELLGKSLNSAMNNVKRFIQQVGDRVLPIGLNYGNYSPEETNPETDVQFESVQSDIGGPVKVHCAEGEVYAFDLGQSHGILPKNIPKIMDPMLSLPNEIKHFQLLDTVYLNGTQPVLTFSPTLAQIAPKADILMDIFQYHRAKMTLLRIDARPPLGYSQMVKIALTSTSATDQSAANRQGVTYDLSKCPVMYFLIPFCDRDFVKERSEPWFKLIIEQITTPVLRTDVPEPFRFRPSFEVLELDYFVHKTIPNVSQTSLLDIKVIANTVRTTTTISNPVLGTATYATGASVMLQGTLIAYKGPLPPNNQQPTFTLIPPGTSGVLNFVATNQLTFVVGGTTYYLVQNANMLTANSYAYLTYDYTTPTGVLVGLLGVAPSLVKLKRPKRELDLSELLEVEGEFQADNKMDLDEPDCNLIEKLKSVVSLKHDYVSELKMKADSIHKEVVYTFERVGGPDHEPIFKCVCQFDGDLTSAIEIGKKNAKQQAAKLMLFHNMDGEYQMDIDVAASEPSAPRNPLPPVAVAAPQQLAMGQTVGVIGAHVEVVEQDFVPINTYTVGPDAVTNDAIFTVRIHPGNFTSGGVESQAQLAFRNHVFSGPGTVNGKISYCTFKVTSAANAFQNARLIISQVPLSYTLAQVNALKATDLKQFPNREHFLHGTETIFNPQWLNRLPVLTNHATDPTNTNGWLVCKILENSLVTDSVSPKLTLWVCANAVNYSMPRTPTALPTVTT